MHDLHHLFAVLPQLRSFLVVIKEGSLHRAAARLHVSQSALSRQMQQLEHELGGHLLERSSTGVVPTPGGRALARRISDFLADFDTHLLAVRRILQGQSGELRIGYLASAFTEYLEPALENFRRLLPQVRVRLLDLYPGEQIAALRRGEIDLAFTQGPEKLLGRDFETRRIASPGSLIAVSRDHPLSSRKRLRLAELRNETFVAAPETHVPGYRQQIVQICRKCGKFRPTIVENADDIDSGFSLIANDNTVALLPAFMRRRKPPGLVLIPIGDTGAVWELFLAWPRGALSGELQALLDLFPAQST